MCSDKITFEIMRESRFHEPRKRCSGVYGCVVASTAACLVLSVTFLGVFLSGSDLLVRNHECDSDAECCPPELPVTFGVDAQCLLPGNETPKCSDHRCVFPQPLHKPDGSPCDDFQFCTVADQCVKGVCASLPRQCSDADWCTTEICSEELGSCTRSLRVEENNACDTLCDGDEDCRAGYFCLPSGQCGKFSESNTSLFFAGANIMACTDTENGYTMVQHYAVYSEGYERDGAYRYRVLVDGDDIVLPASGVLDKAGRAGPEPDGVPLKELMSLGKTWFYEATDTTPAYSENGITVRTVCQDMFDDESCRSAWVNRRYDFQLYMTDCVASGGQVQECLPTKLPVAASMSLSLIQCPFGETVVLTPLGLLRMEYASQPGVALTEVLPAEDVRAVLELQEGDSLDPFLTSVVVCGVNPAHRLSACATNEAEHDCPFRGCFGWDPEDSPITFYREYLTESVPQASASLDGVQFCRGDDTLLGCASPRCSWSGLPNRTPLGGADGFQFTIMADPGQIVMVDVEYKVEICGRRRLVNADETPQKRSLGVLRVK